MAALAGSCLAPGRLFLFYTTRLDDSCGPKRHDADSPGIAIGIKLLSAFNSILNVKTVLSHVPPVGVLGPSFGNGNTFFSGT